MTRDCMCVLTEKALKDGCDVYNPQDTIKMQSELVAELRLEIEKLQSRTYNNHEYRDRDICIVVQT